MSDNVFISLGLSDEVIRAIDAMGFEEPSQIQAQAIPVIMQGHDIIGQAQTGTGKTLAFGAPLLSLMKKQPEIQTLILVPTRELAIQVSEEISRINRFSRYSTLPIYGGQPIDRQLRSLRRGVDIVVGTPGRILDHIKRGSLNLSQVHFFVLDEADEMLNMGFIEDIKSISDNLPTDRQTLLFSATMPDQIRRLAARYMKPDVQNIAVIKNTLTVSLTEQFYFEVKQRDRLETLCRILDADEPDSALIFCRTKRGVDELVEALQSRGYSAEGMHGDMGQNQRLSTLKKFREATIDFLVATDVAARGIDIENISHVINYELPEDVESYVHRIGRTGRANHTGIAYSLVTPREYMLLKQIQMTTKSKIKRKNVPTVDDIFEVRYKNISEKIKAEIENRKFDKFVPLANELDDDYNLVDVAAALIKMLFDKELPGYSESESQQAPDPDAQVRLFMNVGRLDKATPRDIVRFVCDNAGITKDEIGRIDIFDKFTFINVSAASAGDVMTDCAGLKLLGRAVRIQPANERAAR